jgi:hypothetical protein
VIEHVRRLAALDDAAAPHHNYLLGQLADYGQVMAD